MAEVQHSISHTDHNRTWCGLNKNDPSIGLSLIGKQCDYCAKAHALWAASLIKPVNRIGGKKRK